MKQPSPSSRKNQRRKKSSNESQTGGDRPSTTAPSWGRRYVFPLCISIGGALAILAGYRFWPIPPSPPEHATESSEVKSALFKIPVLPKEFETVEEQAKLLQTIEQAIEREPSNAPLLHIAALTYSELLQTEKASEYFRRALEASPKKPDVAEGYAVLLMQLGKQKEAAEVLLPFVDSANGSASLHATLGDCWLQLGEIEKAAELLKRSTKAYPSDVTISLKLAQAELQLGQFESAVEHARSALAGGKNEPATYMTLSTALMRLGKREEAVAVRRQQPVEAPQQNVEEKSFEKSFRPFASHTYSMLAANSATRGDVRQAELWLMQALEIEPTSTKSLSQLADILRRSRRIDDTIQVLARLTQVDSKNPLHFHNLASFAVEAGDIPLAESSLRKLVEVETSGGGHLQLALFLAGIGKQSEASGYAKYAAEHLQSIDAYLAWIGILKAEGKTTEMVDAILEAKRIAPQDPRLRSLGL